MHIVTGDDSETTRRIVEGLQRELPTASVLTELSPVVSMKKVPIYLAVGPNALRAVLARYLDGVVISLFTSSQAYKAIIDKASGRRAFKMTAIYAEPSPYDQFRLISALYKRKVKVAVLVSDKTTHLKPVLVHAAAQAEMDLAIEYLASTDNINRVLNRMENVPVILALPDSSIYNGENLRNILISAYRHNQAVVGFSAEVVRAGAIATTYSDIDDIAIQVKEMKNHFDSTGRVPEPQFPRYFRVAVNDHVARSLNVIVDDRVRFLSRKPRGVQQ